MTTGMAPVPNSTSSHADMHGILKKLIRKIYRRLATDLGKNIFLEFFAFEKVKKWLIRL
jgi:archaellum biogenesis protein FlaJ (TadC family)